MNLLTRIALLTFKNSLPQALRLSIAGALKEGGEIHHTNVLDNLSEQFGVDWADLLSEKDIRDLSQQTGYENLRELVERSRTK